MAALSRGLRRKKRWSKASTSRMKLPNHLRLSAAGSGRHGVEAAPKGTREEGTSVCWEAPERSSVENSSTSSAPATLMESPTMAMSLSLMSAGGARVGDEFWTGASLRSKLGGTQRSELKLTTRI